MKIWESIKKMAQPYSDDDYDDYEDNDEYIDDYDEEPAPRRSYNRRSAPVSAPPVEDEMDDEDFGFAPAAAAAAAPAASTGFNGRVVPMNNNNNGPKQEVVLFRPINFNDTSKAADQLRNRKAVVLNLENVDKAMGRRVVDFLTGCVYAIDGSVKKVAQSAYLFCPSNMDVVGDLEALQAEIESYI